MSEAEASTPEAERGEVARLLSYLLLLCTSAGLFLEAWAIPTSRFEALGAGAFPMLIHGLLVFLLLGAVVGSVRRLPGGAYGRFLGGILDWAWKRRLVFAVFACLGLYLAAMPIAGYPIATLIFLMVLQTLLSPRTPLSFAVALILAVIFSFGLNWLFAEIFNVFLPRGR